MAVASLGLLGTGSSKAAATTLAVTNTTGALIPAGTLVHVTGCWDNIASVTAPTITSSTIGGATATANHATAIGSGVTTTAGSGVWHQCFRALTTASIAIGAVICTLTSNQSAVARAAHAVGWSGVQNALRGTIATGVSTTGAPTVQTAGTALVTGDLVVGSASFENSAQMTGDVDTLNGSWSAIVGTFTTGSTAATNVGTASQFKVITGTGAQSFDPTGGVADTVACVYSLQPVLDPTLTQAAYRFYADGTETGSTALAAQDTSYAADLSGGDVNLLLRTRLQSTNAGAIPATDDFQLQWEKNASGTWTNVTTGGNTVVAFNSANLTDGAATTTRLTGGTGTFQAGGISEDGLVDNPALPAGWVGNTHTELLYSLTAKAADLANGDTLRFRVLRNAATTGLTYAQTPTISITKTSKIETLVDSFDTTIDKSTTKWVSSSTQTIWDTGRAKIPVTTSYYTLATNNQGGYSLTGSFAHARITPPPSSAGGTREMFFEIVRATVTNDKLTMYITGAPVTLNARRTVVGVNTNGPSVAYDPVAHAWLRIRESAGTAYFDTSPDGITWTNFWSTVPGFDISNIYLNILAGYYGTETASDAYVDNVNVVTVATGRPKIWTGAAWAQKPLKVWNGSAWVEKPIKVWTGSAWKTIA